MRVVRVRITVGEVDRTMRVTTRTGEVITRLPRV